MKKTLLILAVLFACVSSSFAAFYTAHSGISWTGTTCESSWGNWILVNGDPYNSNNEPASQNIELNINSNLSALEFYGYALHSASAGNWVYLSAYASSASYYYEFDTGYTPSGDSTQIRELVYNPGYVETLYINMAAGGNGAGRLVVNWAAAI